MWAAYFGNDMLILVILSDIISRLMGMLWIWISGRHEIVDLLIKHGADTEARNSDGATALILASVLGESQFSWI